MCFRGQPWSLECVSKLVHDSTTKSGAWGDERELMDVLVDALFLYCLVSDLVQLTTKLKCQDIGIQQTAKRLQPWPGPAPLESHFSLSLSSTAS